MSAFSDLLTPETLAGIKAKIIGYADSVELKITNWISGGTGEQLFQAVSILTFDTTQVIARAVRGFASLDTATDPGDVDAFDAGNADLDEATGFLSYVGENTYGTVRGGQTFATGTVTFVNAGVAARTFAPESLVFTWTANSPPSPAPTYRNAPDSSIYTDPGGTVTVGAGTSIDLPIVADEIGTGSSVPLASSLSLTTTLVGCTATNAAAVLASDREDAAVYRARCRQASARVSLGGPSAAYLYFATKNIDGTPLQNELNADVGITRVYVSQDSTTGVVSAYYADADGGAAAEDVTAANDNIEAQCFAVPDAITFTGQAATATSIHVVGTAKVRATAGVTAALVKSAILDALSDAFSSWEIGGFDQVAGAGVIYTADIQAVAAAAYPGLYDVVVTTPAGSTTAITLGHVATLNSVAADWSVTLV